MTEHCGCNHHGPATGSDSRTTGLASLTVGEIARQPGARPVLERLGINHCCGAQLTRAEAAAAAGVPLAEVLRELDEAGARA